MNAPDSLSVRQIYQRHFLLIERNLAIALSIGLVVWGEKFGGIDKVNAVLNGNRAAVYTAFAAIFGALLGFVITSVSILLPATQMPSLRVVAESPYFGHLWKTFISAMWCTAYATVAAVAALLFDKDSSCLWCHRIFYAVFLTSALSVLRLWRCIWILEYAIRIVTNKPA